MKTFLNWVTEAAAAPAPAPSPTAPKPSPVPSRVVDVSCPYCGASGKTTEDAIKKNLNVKCNKCGRKFPLQSAIGAKNKPTGSPPSPSGSPPSGSPPSGSPPSGSPPSGSPPTPAGNQRLKDPAYLAILQSYNGVGQVQQKTLDYFRNVTGRGKQFTQSHVDAIQQTINGVESYKQQLQQILQKAQERLGRF